MDLDKFFKKKSDKSDELITFRYKCVVCGHSEEALLARNTLRPTKCLDCEREDDIMEIIG